MLDTDIFGQTFFKLGNFRPENVFTLTHDLGDCRVEFAANPFTLRAEIDELHHCSIINVSANLRRGNCSATL